MSDTKAQRIAYFYLFAERIGVDMDTADKLRRIEMTLHRWSEAECNGEIQRDEDDRYVCTQCGQRKSISQSRIATFISPSCDH